MAAVSVRRLDDEVKERLRVRAAEHGRSLEAEIRHILTEAVRDPADHHFGRAVLTAFAGKDSVQLEVPERTEAPRVVDFE